LDVIKSSVPEICVFKCSVLENEIKTVMSVCEYEDRVLVECAEYVIIILSLNMCSTNRTQIL